PRVSTMIHGVDGHRDSEMSPPTAALSPKASHADASVIRVPQTASDQESVLGVFRVPDSSKHPEVSLVGRQARSASPKPVRTTPITSITCPLLSQSQVLRTCAPLSTRYGTRTRSTEAGVGP